MNPAHQDPALPSRPVLTETEILDAMTPEQRVKYFQAKRGAKDAPPKFSRKFLRDMERRSAAGKRIVVNKAGQFVEQKRPLNPNATRSMRVR